MSKTKQTENGAMKVTEWMRFKAKMMYRWELIKVFLRKFFDIRELVRVEFKYEIRSLKKDGHPDMKKSPSVGTYTRIAWVSRTTPIEKVHKLFDLSDPLHSFKVTSAQIVPFKKVPRV